jgi:Ger(x)C family germination protein
VKLKKTIALFLALCMLLTSGCWDMVEVEKRAFVGAITVDLINKDEENGEKNNTSPFCEEKPKVIKVTFRVNEPSKALQGGPGAFVSLNIEAANMPDAMQELGSRIPRVPFYGQVRLLVFTDKLLKNEKVFKEVLDEFERRAIISQQMKVVAFKGDPEDMTKVEPKLENLMSLYVTGILENSKVLSNTASITLSDLLSTLRNNEGTGVIPVLEAKLGEDNNFIINKLALIKDYKLLTVLDTKYVKSYKIITDNLENGRKLIDYKGISVPYYIFSSRRRIWLEEDKGVLKYKVKVEMEGDIEQFEFDKMLFDSKVIADVEKTLDKYIASELETTTTYFQREIEHDFLEFKEYTNKYHYKIFKKYENNWDEAFKNAKIEYEVEAKIRRIGTSKK